MDFSLNSFLVGVSGLSSDNVCYLGHFFIGSIESQKNLYHETFYFIFDLLLKKNLVNLY